MGKYLAFISYRHTERDMKASAFLRKELEGWHLPKDCALPKRRRVFRDTDELPTSSDLGKDIENALDESDYLIAVCSEEYPGSRWCLAEIEHFIKSGRKDRILPVLISGTKETSFPEMIRDLPVAADLRENPDIKKHTAFAQAESAETWSTGVLKRRVRAEIPALFSKMSDAAPESFRRSQRNFRIGLTSVIVLICAAAIFGFAQYAMSTGNRLSMLNVQIAEATDSANEAAEEAVEERNTALLRQAEYLSNLAWEKIDEGDFDEAIRLTLEALPEDLHGEEPVSASAVSALRSALSMTVRLPYCFERSVPLEKEILTYGASPYADSVLIETEDGWGYFSFTDGSFARYSGRLTGTSSWITDAHPLRTAADEEAKGNDAGDESEQMEPEKEDSGSSEATDQAGTDIVSQAQKDVEDILRAAAKEGYRAYYANEAGTPCYYIFYDAKLPLRCSTTYSKGEFTYTLNGDPFYADHINASDNEFAAWTEDGSQGKMALFSMQEAEALTQIELMGRPVSISWAESNADYDFRRILVVDESGTLLIYHRKTGELTERLEGDYTYVQSIYYQSPRYFTITGDGNAHLTDAATNEVIYDIDAPAPILEIWPCQAKGYLLVLCEDGVRFYDLDDGSFIMDLETNGVPEHIQWGGYRENGYSFTGNTIAAFYKDRADIYLPDIFTDTGMTDYQALFHEGTTTTENPSYSPDGHAVYLSNASKLSKWDAKTGEFLWETSGEEETAPVGYRQTADGSAIWQVMSSRKELRKIDTETGETLLNVELPMEPKDAMLPQESADGTLGLETTGIYSHKLFVFNMETGEVLWGKDTREIMIGEKAAPCFSKDGSKVYCILNTLDTATEIERRNRSLAAFDALSGKELSRRDLPEADENTGIYLFPQQDVLVLIKKDPEKENAAILIYSLDSFALLGETVFKENGSPEPVVSFSGTLSLYWTAENEDQDIVGYCCTLLADGTFGETLPADSYEGRLLWVTEENHYLLYGEEAYAAGTQIRRLSDGVLLLGGTVAAETETGQAAEDTESFAVSPDGSSVCICYHGLVSDSLPFLVYSSDVDTLVAKAKQHMEAVLSLQ